MLPNSSEKFILKKKRKPVFTGTHYMSDTLLRISRILFSFNLPNTGRKHRLREVK